MNSKDNWAVHLEVELSYRALYGKLFASLFSRFGSAHIATIEDAIQNSFYKSLKCWKPDRMPDNIENWLFIVARNDVINQLKRKSDSRFTTQHLQVDHDHPKHEQDLRLQTILYLVRQNTLSSNAIVLFVLKNIFGLHIKEISNCTLQAQDAIYKSIKRTSTALLSAEQDKFFPEPERKINTQETQWINEILYAVFSIGFDSFNNRHASLVNEDLCLESLALAKVFNLKHRNNSTQNLLSLFCFHIARIPAKTKGGQIVSFFRQKAEDWDQDFIRLGFHFLVKPEEPDRYYLEALITSKHMTAKKPDHAYWLDIVGCYDMLYKLTGSPIVKLNLSYCLHKVNQTSEALQLLESVASQLPSDHFYYSLVKADILEETNSKASRELVWQVYEETHQTLRQNYILAKLMKREVW